MANELDDSEGMRLIKSSVWVQILEATIVSSARLNMSGLISILALLLVL